MRNNKDYAIPETIDGKKWNVATSFNPSVDMKNLVFSAPPGETLEELGRRMHEYAHIRYSPEHVAVPPNKPNIQQAIAAAEDYRIETLTLKAGLYQVEYQLNADYVKKVKQAAKEGKIDKYGAACALFAAMQQAKRGELEDALLPVLSEIERDVVHSVRGYFYDLSFEETMKAANYLYKAFYQQNPEDMEEPPPVDEQAKNQQVDIDDDGVGAKTGDLTVIDHTQKMVRQLRRNKRSDMGLHFRHPDRIYTDGKCFALKKRKKMGTVLIDCSGSMDVDLEHLKEVVEKSGGATIGAYSGWRDRGDLHILAKKGKIVQEMPNFLGGNDIDEAALKWLAQQPGPRVWLSDGGVSGANGRDHIGALVRCLHIVNNNNIEFVASREVKSLIKMLGGKK